ncbi:unnamed protein product [Sphagnum compactum]
MAEQADHVFVYGKLRPDVVGTALPLPDACDAQKAWLLGGRLYSFNRGGQEHAAVRLREAGQATSGWVVKAPTPDVMSVLLRESEAREYSPQLYEKDIVEVVTEKGERVPSYVYHRPDVDVSNPVPKGDWLQHLK